LTLIRLARRVEVGGVTSRKGQLLIASRRLVDPNFARSVVLIVHHDDDGAMGLVLNRPLEVSVAEACGESVEAAAGVERPVHQGGPCPGPLMVLFGPDEEDAVAFDASGEEVVAGVRFTAERGDIESLMRGHEGRIKYFANYSGWGADQLESEITEGSWLLTPATAGDVFASDAAQWTKLATRLTLGQWIDPARIPDDPSVN
jgi:putative transcriptional regulator